MKGQSPKASQFAYVTSALAFALLIVGLVACEPSATPLDANAATMTATMATNPRSRIHDITPESLPFFVRVTFTSSTTFDQAVAILGASPYPWDCDDPRTPVAPSLDSQRATFNGSHILNIEYPSWEQLTRIAASPRVITVDGMPTYQCP